MIAFKGGRISAGGKRSGLGSGFGSLVAYLKEGKAGAPLNPERVAWVSYRNLDGISDPTLAARLMRAYAEENPRVERPVYHVDLSLSPGEHLTPEQWNAAVDQVLARMGLAEPQAVVMAHGDTDREHVHIVVNRVGDDGRAWDPKRDMAKAYEAVHEIEAEHGLRRTGEPALTAPDLSPGAHQEAQRTGQQPLADWVRQEGGPDLARATSWRDLDERLAARGLRLESAERGSGVVVTDGFRRASLSHVDRDLSGPKLAQRFGETFREYRTRAPEAPAIQAPAKLAAAEPLLGRDLAEQAEALVEHIQATRATFTEADLRRAAFYQKDSAAVVEEALNLEDTVEIGREVGGAIRYSTQGYLEAEAKLFDSSGRLAGHRYLRLEEAAVAQTIDRRAPHLSAEQREAVFHATADNDLAQIVGRAGAGKTTVARTIADAYREQGYEVRGAALAGKAAEGLEKEAGIPSRTLASLERAWAEGREGLDHRTVLVIDEAGMIDTRQLSRVLYSANRASSKVVLLGDPDQLKAIGAGDAYRGLLERYPSARLETVRRQTEPWQRSASEHLAEGRVTVALDAYDAAGRLHWQETKGEARADLVTRYLADRRESPEASQLIVAYRNDDARRLNEAVRNERRVAGELGPGLSVGGAEYALGDRIAFLKNDHQGREVTDLAPGAKSAGVKNGTLGTVEQVEAGRFVARLDDGRRVAFDPEHYDSIAHGYAVTLHKSQGATVDRVYTLADPYMDRNATYVALTRHREAVHLYADRETFGDRDGLDKALSRASRKDLAQDYAAADLRRIASRVGEWRQDEHALGGLVSSLSSHLSTLDRAESSRRELEAARATLRQTAARVYADPEAAIAALRADRTAHDRLAVGEAGAYDPLLGRDRFLLGKDAQRSQAESAVPTLRAAVWGLREAEARSAGQQTAISEFADRGRIREAEALLARLAASLGPSPAKVHSIHQDQTERQNLAATRYAVQRAAASIYFNHQEATRALLADPRALNRLASGEIGAYGSLRLECPASREAGQGFPRREPGSQPSHRALGSPGEPADGSPAPSGIPREYRHAGDQSLARSSHLRLSAGVLSLAASRAGFGDRRPPNGQAAVYAAISLLPDPIRTPVRLLAHVTKRALGIGLDLGR